MGVVVVTLVVGDLPYARRSCAINRAYAQRHGYDFCIWSHATPARHVAWSKVTAMRQLLPQYQTILYLDADAFVVDPSQPIEESGKPLTLGSNSRDTHFHFNEFVANSGIVLVRRSTAAIKALRDWHRWGNHPDYANDPVGDQNAFNNFVLPKYRDAVEIIKTPHFGGQDGTFIRHLLLMSDAERLAALEVA